MKNIKYLILAVVLILSVLPIYSQDQVPLPNKKGMVGLQLYESEGRFFAGGVFRKSPAERAGIKAGDEIISVGGKNVNGLTLQDVLNLFDGEPGSVTDVRVKRKDEEINLNVTRISPLNLYEDSDDFKAAYNSKKEGEILPQQIVQPPEVQSPENVNKEIILKPEDISPEFQDLWTKLFEEKYGIKFVFIDEVFAQKLGALFSEGLLILSVNNTYPAATVVKKWDLITKINNINVLQYLRTNNPMTYEFQQNPPELNLNISAITGESNVKVKPKTSTP